MSKNKQQIQLHKNRKLPTIQELYDNTDLAIRHDDFNVLMNQDPPASWVKVNKYAGNSRYLPIEKVEWLLRRIFKQTRIEITGQGTAFNGVWVTVRVHYVHPVTGEWQFHDGIGAEALQVKSGSSPADLANLNKGALAMAFPLAKSQAIKDACDHFGKAFGADLNRKDVLAYSQDERLHDVKREKEKVRLLELIESSSSADELLSLKDHVVKNESEDLLSRYYEKLLEFCVFRGDYDPEEGYSNLDYVNYDGEVYVFNGKEEDGPSIVPIEDENYWEKLNITENED